MKKYLFIAAVAVAFLSACAGGEQTATETIEAEATETEAVENVEVQDSIAEAKEQTAQLTITT